MQKTKKESLDLYLDYVNNFLTIEKFAEHHGMDIVQACCVLREGRLLNEGWIK